MPNKHWDTIDLLIPAFFVATALAMPLQTVHHQLGSHGLLCLLALTGAAFASKLVAGYVFGKMRKYSSRDSAQLGILLNCRGVTEIAIASVGYQAHLIGPFAFAALCALAILTTAVTAPLFRAVGRSTRMRGDDVSVSVAATDHKDPLPERSATA